MSLATIWRSRFRPGAMPIVAAIIAAAAIAPMRGAGAADPATKPSTRPAVVTYREVYRDCLASNRRTLTEAYQKIGRHNPKWDEQAVEFLDLMSRETAAAQVPSFYRMGDPAAHSRALELSKKLREAGCDDPLVRYVDVILRSGSGMSRSEIAAGLRDTLAGMKKGKYPLARVVAASMQLARATQDVQEAAELTRYVYAQMPTVCSGEMPDDDRPVYLNFAWTSLQNRNHQRTFVEAMKKRADADPWIRDMADGRLHMLLAWDSRGAGPANAVTPDGWGGFYDNLAQARDALTRAWKLKPMLPEAPKEMITVAMVAGQKLNEDKLDWFDRALRAQIDYLPAYQAMIDATSLKRGGSYEEMFKLADGCIQEPLRFDTLIPWQYVEIVNKVGQEGKKSWGPLASPKVYASVVRVLEGYAQHFGPDNGGGYYKTLHALMASGLDKYAEARQLLDEVAASGHQPDAEAMKYMEVKSPVMQVAFIYAKSGADAKTVQEVTDMVRRGELQQALPKAKQLRQHAAPADRTIPYYDWTVTAIEAQLKFQAGEWSPLVREPSLRDWAVLEGEWKFDDKGSLVGVNHADAPKSLLWRGRQLGRDPGNRFEIAAVAHFAPQAVAAAKSAASRPAKPGTAPATQPVVHSAAGVVIYHDEPRRRGFVVMDIGTQKAGFAFPPETIAYPCRVRDGCTFSVRVDDHTLTLLVGGKQVGEPYALGNDFAGDFAIGFGGTEQSEVRFSDMRIRKLPAANKAPATRPEGK